MASSSSSLLLLLFLHLFFFSFFLWISPCSSDEGPFQGVDLETPIIHITLSPQAGSSFTRPKDVLSCGRVRVAGLSRFKLGSYPSSFRVTLAPSVRIPESNIHICFHRNASLGMCECEKDEWKDVRKGFWSSVMSPYEDRYVDVKVIGKVSDDVIISVEEDFQQWRLCCLAIGFVLLLLAPIVSNWVPFYYSSSMAVGVLLVIIILLFQGMKLLPTGRKSAFYLTIYGSVIGAGSFLLHQFSILVNSILINFGLTEEMHNPVSIFLLVGVILAGAALGYWIVRKFVISEDGSVDVGIAQFVKWAMRFLAATCIFQSSLDTPLAIGALASCFSVCLLITSVKWKDVTVETYNEYGSPLFQKAKQKHSRAEFLSRSAKKEPRKSYWNSPKISSDWSDSPIKGLVSPSSSRVMRREQQDYYSTLHKTPNRKKFTKKEWDKFTQDSTRQAVAEWASSPEFTDWIIEQADRIQLLPSDSSDETVGSGSDSTEENVVESRGNRLSLFKWY